MALSWLRLAPDKRSQYGDVDVEPAEPHTIPSQISHVSGQVADIALSAHNTVCNVGRRDSHSQSRFFPSTRNFPIESSQSSVQTWHVSGQTSRAVDPLPIWQRSVV